MAVARNPLIRQAASDVEAARGNMIQAGAYPNPHVGYQCDDINTGLTAGYQGGASARRSSPAASCGWPGPRRSRSPQCGTGVGRARYDLATQVRSNYLGVLVARERIKVNDALAQFADRVYRMQAKRVSAGQAAAYEPLQLRVLAVQAQTQLIQSNQQYVAAWRKLAVTLNCPEMAPTPLAGRIDGPVPLIGYEAAREQILRTHTDLVTAQNAVAQAQYQLRLARITPDLPEHRHQYRHRARLHDASLRHGRQLAGRRSASRSSTTTAATSSRPRRRWCGPAANTSGPETICSPTWPIRSPVTRRTVKRPSSIAAVFSSIRCGPIAAPTSVPGRSRRGFQRRGHLAADAGQHDLHLHPASRRPVAGGCRFGGADAERRHFCDGADAVKACQRVGRIPRPDSAQAPETRPEGRDYFRRPVGCDVRLCPGLS